MSAMVVAVTHFAFNSTEPWIKITRSVDELKLEATNCLATSASNSFQSERMSVLVLSRKSQVTLIIIRTSGLRVLASSQATRSSRDARDASIKEAYVLVRTATT